MPPAEALRPTSVKGRGSIEMNSEGRWLPMRHLGQRQRGTGTRFGNAEVALEETKTHADHLARAAEAAAGVLRRNKIAEGASGRDA